MDGPVPIGPGQPISQPFVVALMTDLAVCECSLLSITTVFDRPDRNALFLGKIQNRETEIEGLCQICHKAKLFKLA
jgi:hypothetical protein